MKTLAQRENARKQLKKPAQQLRWDSGSNIAGQSQQGMQQLAGDQGQGGQQGQQLQQGQNQSRSTDDCHAECSSIAAHAISWDEQYFPTRTGEQWVNPPILTPVPGSGPQSQQNMAIVPNPWVASLQRWSTDARALCLVPNRVNPMH